MTIDRAKLLSLLNDVFNETAKLRLGDGEATYHCPICKHAKNKLEICINETNDSFGYYHCWTCNISGKSFRSLFKKLNVDKSYYGRLYDIIKVKHTNIEPNNNIKIDNTHLPHSFISLSTSSKNSKISPHRKHALKYLYNRGLTEDDILRYNIGYAEDGPYNGRIIIPSYDKNGNLNFFSARSFYDSIKLKYKNPNWSKDIIGFELFINWQDPITVVEGVFDGIAVKRNAIPLFGKTLSYSLKEAIIKYGVDRVNILLDNDARSDAIEIQKFLLSYEIDVHLIKTDEKDPSVLGFKNINKIIEESSPTNFKNIIEMKLYE